MALLPFRRKSEPGAQASADVQAFLGGYSIEVMPRTAAKIDDFRALLPAGTRVYIAHIDGTPIDDMVATARRIAGDGFAVMPHFPARMIAESLGKDVRGEGCHKAEQISDGNAEADQGEHVEVHGPD